MTPTRATVAVGRDDAVAVVTIDRPDRRNVLDEATKVALRDALGEVAEDSSVRGRGPHGGRVRVANAVARSASSAAACSARSCPTQKAALARARLRAGDRIEVQTPTGSFRADPEAGGQHLCIAAGSGITPMTSIVSSTRRNYALEDTEVNASFMLTCQSHPVTETVTVNFDA